MVKGNTRMEGGEKGPGGQQGDFGGREVDPSSTGGEHSPDPAPQPILWLES